MHDPLDPGREAPARDSSSQEFLARLRARDEAAWGQLHQEHFPRLWHSVNRILLNAGHSDDVVQEAFLKAYREIDRFAGQSQIGTWLYRVAINQALDYSRKLRRRERWVSFFSPLQEDDPDAPPSVPELPVEPEVARGLEGADTMAAIEAALEELSPDHRAVVQLRLLDELSLAETARVLGCKEGTVNSRLHYACGHLRKKLRTLLPAP